jgi:signal transduction histidine kinase
VADDRARKYELSFDDVIDACRSRAFRFLLPTLGHALRAPLNGMIINLELLQELLKPGLEESPEVLARRERSVAALGRTVAQLRAAVESTLIEAGLTANEPATFDLTELVWEIVAIIRPQATVQRVAVEAAVADVPARVSGHRGAIRQAVRALAVNALEAMPCGGDVAIRLERAADDWMVSVVDGGPGIAPEIAPLVGLQPCTTKPGRGGAGLLCARAIAEEHGGRLVVASGESGGTEARLVIPADPAS